MLCLAQFCLVLAIGWGLCLFSGTADLEKEGGLGLFFALLFFFAILLVRSGAFEHKPYAIFFKRKDE